MSDKCRVCLTLADLTSIVLICKHERKEMNTRDTRFNVETQYGKTTNVTKYYFSAPQGYLTILLVHSHTFLLNQSIHLHASKSHNLTLYLYCSYFQVGSIQITMTNNHHHSQMESIHEIIRLHIPKQKNPSMANPTR